jgi:hypothetical protein
MSHNGWTRRKFEWLKALAADNGTRGIAHDIAILLALRYLNSDSHKAWPAIDTLANELNVSRRGVVDALNRLVADGWLKRKRGGGHATTVYWLCKEIPSARKSAADCTGDRQTTSAVQRRNQCSALHPPVQSSVKNQCSALHGNKRRNKDRIREGKREGKTRLTARLSLPLNGASGFSHEDIEVEVNNSQRKTQKSHPRKTQDWVLDNEAIEVAQRVAGWTLEQAEHELYKLKRYLAEKGGRTKDWRASWERWCEQGRKYAEKQQTAQNGNVVTGFRSEVLGIEEWLRSTKH